MFVFAFWWFVWIRFALGFGVFCAFGFALFALWFVLVGGFDELVFCLDCAQGLHVMDFRAFDVVVLAF